MKNQDETISAAADRELFIKMAILAWQTYNGRMNTLFEKLSDEQLLSEVAPGRNTGIYLLGHMIAIGDAMRPLLGFGEKIYPELWKIFVETPDHSGQKMPAVATLRKNWEDINIDLTNHINGLQPDEWFNKHSAVSEEDFAREPYRNKLNLLMNRTNHLSYHLGQLAFLQKN